MSSPAAPVSWGRFLRYPLLFLLVGAGLFTFFDLQLDRDKATHFYAMGKAGTVLLTLSLLAGWLYFSSGLRKSRVALGLLLAVAIFSALFRPKPDGSMYISFELRRGVAKLLGISHDDDVNRQARAVNAAVTLVERPGDWPEYRGKGRTGVYGGPELRLNWNEQPPKPLWRHLVGNGYASFTVVNGHLVTIEQRLVDGEDREAVVCYQASTGLEVWSCSWPGRFDELAGGPGPRATPTVDGGEVFALGAMGRLVCVDGNTGSEKWAVETLRNNANLTWAMAGSPLVHAGLVIVTPGTQAEGAVGRAVLAFDRATGREVWASGSAQGSYSSPMIMTLGGVEHLLVFEGLGLAGLDPKTGVERWRHPWTNTPRINVAQPVKVADDELVIASGYDTGAARLKVSREGDAFQVRELWKSRSSVMRCKFASFVVLDETIYGLNDGYLEAVDAKTGKALWKDDRRRFKAGEAYGHGQLLLAGKHLLVVTEYGELVLVEASREELKEVARVPVLSGKCWNPFAVVNGVIYLRNDREMTALEAGVLPSRLRKE